MNLRNSLAQKAKEAPSLNVLKEEKNRFLDLKVINGVWEECRDVIEREDQQ